ncbi:11857_t:CDS:2, partial [Dentiscutata heterogama]
MGETLKFQGLNKIEGGKDFVNKQFSEVLKNLKVIDSNYATEPIETSFNWNEIASGIKDIEGEWYLVAFRSIGSVNANNNSLSYAEKKAYNKAEKHGGLLKYWSGEFNQNRECLSMCIWASKDIAVNASKKSQHTAAKRLANISNYEFYDLESRLRDENQRLNKDLEIVRRFGENMIANQNAQIRNLQDRSCANMKFTGSNRNNSAKLREI